MADRHIISRKKRSCSLYRLKALLEIERDEQPLGPEESAEFTKIEEFLIPVIQEELRSIGENVSTAVVCALLHSTRIETDSNLSSKPALQGGIGDLSRGAHTRNAVLYA